MTRSYIYNIEKCLSYVSHRVLNFDDEVLGYDDPIRLLKGFLLTPSDIEVYFGIKDYLLLDKKSFLRKFLNSLEKKPLKDKLNDGELSYKYSVLDELNDKESYIHDYLQHYFQEYYDQFLMEDVLI